MEAELIQMTVKGGTGGAGGAGGRQGGSGGAGEGARVYVNSEQARIYTGGETEEMERKKIINWISPINYAPRHQQIYDSCHEGTGEWFLQHSDFLSWKLGHGQTLWCVGGPGVGKSVLA
ncbi:Ankyrin 2,3/unc44 [Mycena indigotica]|uniref:Ankyrin 2,3/unc44 n=1 Tax=Mycena indigotica TaxID=2126181 RepID=A0A8H6TFY2_9AGAR|nr:Ankyrin 2,3/unc44 [Mycena indigotica]KAF7316027.1 Ankyrin 2,3/unc44 [Mycena indigotica]